MLASLAAGMVAARCLTQHDYATVRQTFLAYEFVAPLLMRGLPSALYYFLPRETVAKRGVIIDNVALLLISGSLFSLFILCGGSRILALRFSNPDLAQTLPWLVLYPLVVMPGAGLPAVLVCADRTRTLAVYNVGSHLVLTLCGIVAVVVTRSYEFPVIVRSLVPGLFLPLAMILMFGSFPGPWRGPRWSTMRAMLAYSVPLGLASTLGSITLQLHGIVVASLCAPEEFAVYINGAMEIPLVGVVTGSITTVVFAEMAELCARGDKAAALRLFRRASLRSACILFPVMCFLLVTAQPFILLLYSARYADSVWPFLVYLFVLPVRIVVYGAALMALGLTRLVLVRSILDLVISSILCAVLVRTIGFMGAAIATVVTLYLWTIPFNVLTIAQGFAVPWRQILPFRDLARVMAVCLACMPLAAVGAHGVPLNPLGRFGLAACLYGPLVTYLLYRMSLLIPPPWLESYIPGGLRVHS
jgi:O-antigen/teichoic acid export membrane protein